MTYTAEQLLDISRRARDRGSIGEDLSDRLVMMGLNPDLILAFVLNWITQAAKRMAPEQLALVVWLQGLELGYETGLQRAFDAIDE